MPQSIVYVVIISPVVPLVFVVSVTLKLHNPEHVFLVRVSLRNHETSNSIKNISYSEAYNTGAAHSQAGLTYIMYDVPGDYLSRLIKAVNVIDKLTNAADGILSAFWSEVWCDVEPGPLLCLFCEACAHAPGRHSGSVGHSLSTQV